MTYATIFCRREETVMTKEKREYADWLGLFSSEDDSPAVERDKKVALRYLMSGAPIPRTLLLRLQRKS